MNKALITFLCLAVTSLAFAGKSGWDDNYQEALTKAKAEKKLALLDFTGSDWCGWCMKLDNEVFAKAEFRKLASESLVLVELDFPQGRRLSKKTKEQNQQLKSKFNVNGYPTIILVDGEGKEVQRWSGYSATFFDELKKALPSKKSAR